MYLIIVYFYVILVYVIISYLLLFFFIVNTKDVETKEGRNEHNMSILLLQTPLQLKIQKILIKIKVILKN